MDILHASPATTGHIAAKEGKFPSSDFLHLTAADISDLNVQERPKTMPIDTLGALPDDGVKKTCRWQLFDRESLQGKPERERANGEPAPMGKNATKKAGQMLGGRKTVICEFLGTGMISVMPVSLLSVHPWEYSQQGHIRYVPSVCVYRWTCPVPPHKPPLQAL